jgi:hypothetical protein
MVSATAVCLSQESFLFLKHETNNPLRFDSRGLLRSRWRQSGVERKGSPNLKVASLVRLKSNRPLDAGGRI